MALNVIYEVCCIDLHKMKWIPCLKKGQKLYIADMAKEEREIVKVDCLLT